MLFHFTPHIHNLDELLKEEGPKPRIWQSPVVQISKKSFLINYAGMFNSLKKTVTCAAHMH